MRGKILGAMLVMVASLALGQTPGYQKNGHTTNTWPAGIPAGGLLSFGTLNSLGASANNSTVAGGSNNVANGIEDAISGGSRNVIDNNRQSVIAGGKNNHIANPTGAGAQESARASVIGGGEDNYITNDAAHSVIMGGLSNIIDGARYAVEGGWKQRIYAISAKGASNAAILSGWQNTNSVKNSVIAGGWQNQIQYTNNLVNADDDNDFNFIGGGWDNVIRGGYGSVICGGYTNTIYNTINQRMSSACIVGGIDNRIGAEAYYSGIVNGVDNIIAGTAARSFIGAGNLNACLPVNGENAMVICGGAQNTNRAGWSFIGAGTLNWIESGNYSAILAGTQNYLFGNTGSQFIIGRNLTNDFLNGGSDDRLDMGFNERTKTTVDISGLTTQGSMTYNVTNKTTTYTATIADHIILCSASGGAFTVTLPAANSRKGLVLEIKKTDASANAVTVTRAGADTIQGATTVSLASQYSTCTIFSDGTSVWYKYAPNQ